MSSRRPGEITPQAIDYGWPHQVEVLAKIREGHAYKTVHGFAAQLSVAPRNGRSVRRDDLCTMKASIDSNTLVS